MPNGPKMEGTIRSPFHNSDRIETVVRLGMQITDQQLHIPSILAKGGANDSTRCFSVRLVQDIVDGERAKPAIKSLPPHVSTTQSSIAGNVARDTEPLFLTITDRKG